MKRTTFLAMWGLWITVVGALAEPPAHEFVQVFSHLSFTNPLFITASPDSTQRLFVVNQGGKIHVFKNTVQPIAKVFVDLSDVVNQEGGELGLLGLAFAPDYAQSRVFYVAYSDSNRALTVARLRTSTTDPDEADKTTLESVLRVPKTQNFPNHNGGMIAFSPKDGFLYIGTGDGGGAGDPKKNSQNKQSLLGKILRIDVRDLSKKYTIPSDNPLVGEASAKPEIFALGLRNPWRFSFDPLTGQLFAGDVGQNKQEEINIVKKGGNYGWNVFEGLEPFQNPQGLAASVFEAPLFTYGRSTGFSVTGGMVYRGKTLPELTGQYVFGDFGGRTFSLKLEETPTGPRVLSNTEHNSVTSLASFGTDADGEIYAVSLGGEIFKLRKATP